MIDGLLFGLLGGLFGPAFAHWVSRFRYWAIFFVAMLTTKVLLLFIMLKKLGFDKTVESFEQGIDPAFFFVPMGIGAGAVIIALVGSLGASKENKANSSRDQ